MDICQELPSNVVQPACLLNVAVRRRDGPPFPDKKGDETRLNQAASGERGTKASSVRNAYGLHIFRACEPRFARILLVGDEYAIQRATRRVLCVVLPTAERR